MFKYLNYFFLAYCIIKPATISLFGSIDGAGRIEVFLVLFILFGQLITKDNFLKLAVTTPCRYWFLWCIYVTIAWLYFGLPHPTLTNFLFIFHCIFKPCLALFISIQEYKRDSKLFSQWMLLVLVFYTIIGVFFDTGGSEEERGGELLGNRLALNAMAMSAVAAFQYIRNNIKLYHFILCILLATSAIMMVATRKALTGEFIILLFFIFSKINLKKVHHVFLLIVIAIGIYYAIDYILNNTLLGERLSNIEEDGLKYNDSNNPFLNLLGDRAFFYLVGWDLFIDNQLFGIGINNFMAVTKYTLPIHSEYIVQLAECGIVGTIMFLMFNIGILQLIFRSRKNDYDKSTYGVCLGWMCALLFIGLTAWTYDQIVYFVVTGLIIGHCLSRNQLSKDSDQ